MKKILLTIISFAMIFSLVQCSTVMSLVNPKVMACKLACDTVYNRCMTNAKKNASRKTACKATKDTAYMACDRLH